MKKSKEEITEVKRLLGVHPVEDAKAILRFVIKQPDVDVAVPGDFENCALAVVLKKITGVNAGVVIFPTTAYVPWDKNGDGNFIIERYCQQSRSKRAIGQFDLTGNFPLGEYILTPPSKSSSLKVKTKANRQRRANPIKRQAEAKRTRERAKIKKAQRRERKEQPQMSFLEIRRGSGRAALVKKAVVKYPERPSPTMQP